MKAGNRSHAADTDTVLTGVRCALRVSRWRNTPSQRPCRRSSPAANSTAREGSIHQA